jgi:large subunit ribosomal protein L9
MDVILLQDVEKVGLRGDVVGVARGYARNFLLPRKLAEVATPAKVAELERREARRSRHEASTNDQAVEVKRLIEELELRFDVSAGPTGTLFGSVTATNVADELWARKKIRVDRRKIDLHDPIKRIGRYTIPVEVFTGVIAELRTLVVPEGGELPPEEEIEAAEAAAAAEEAEAAAESEAAPEVVEFVEPEPVAEVEESVADVEEPVAEAEPEPVVEAEPDPQLEPEPEPATDQ